MQLKYNNPQFKGNRKKLRKKMTEEEIILWQYLKNKQLGYKFRRQMGFGRYIIDFYCSAKRLAIELDGSQHVEDKRKYDKDRDKYLNSLNIKVLRIWNNEIKENIEGVIEEIRCYLED